jgi:hypothetical protein
MVKMLHQFYRGGALRLLDGDRLGEVLDRFEALPLWFLKFHSSSDLDEVRAPLDNTCVLYSVSLVVVLLHMVAL